MDWILEKVPAESRWTIATKVLTGQLIATAKALRDALGQEKYNEVCEQSWTERGKAAKQLADTLGLAGDDAKSAAETLQALDIVTTGPEFKFETVEAASEKTVLRCTGCAWWNRQQELGIPGDLCSVAALAYCNALAKSLNPKLTVSGTKSMPRGDPYCESVWELQK